MKQIAAIIVIILISMVWTMASKKFDIDLDGKQKFSRLHSFTDP